MLYIGIHRPLPAEYHIGDKIPMEDKNPEWIQADGDELLLCLKILGRTTCNNRVHKFYGDIAKEIVNNWE